MSVTTCRPLVPVLLAASCVLLGACSTTRCQPTSLAVDRCSATAPCAEPPLRGPLELPPNPELRGYADYHAHLFADAGFGGFLFAGSPYAYDASDPEAQIAKALAPCEHTRFRHLMTRIVVGAAGEPSHGRDGYDSFEVWPRYYTSLHQQAYIDWLYRAYQHGQRLIVVTAVNNEILCRTAHRTASCNDMDVVREQIRQARRMADDVAEHESGWLEIAYTAEQAERIVRENRLALVLAVEVDTLLDCGRATDSACEPDQVRAALDELHREGVRQITPIHLADNGFGGAALYDERFAVNQLVLRDTIPSIEDCSDEDVVWKLRGKRAIPFPLRALVWLRFGKWYSPDIPEDLEQAAGHCNQTGLRDAGRTLLRRMMEHGMLIDTEHMSRNSFHDTTALTHDLFGPKGYPVMSSHVWYRHLKLSRDELTDRSTTSQFVSEHQSELRNEMQKSDAEIARIIESGGVVGILTNQGDVHPADAEGPQTVANSCDTSARSFAQAYLHGTNRGDSVGLGTDVNGLAGQPGPRFGSHACGAIDAKQGCRALQPDQAELQRSTPDRTVKYDGTERVGDRVLHPSSIGTLRFDVNTQGVAHYGMIPDFIAELHALGIDTAAMDPLWQSTRAYIEMWKLAEERARELRALGLASSCNLGEVATRQPGR